MLARLLRPHLFLALVAAVLLLLLRGAAWLPLPWGLADDSLQVFFSLESGAYERNIPVRLTVGHPQATILYTTNGRLPTADNITKRYTTPLYLTADPASTMAIQARALLPDGTLGEVQTAVYAVGLDATIPIVSLIVEPGHLWDVNDGIFSQPEARGAAWERPFTLTYIDENGRFAFDTLAGVRIHGGTSRLYDKKSVRLYFRQEYGRARLNYRFFPDSELDSFKRLVLHAGGQDMPRQRANGTLLRNALVGRLARQMDGLVPGHRHVLLLINGERWGIYNLRERIDEDYFHDHFGIEPAEGDAEHWAALTQFVDTHDLSEPAHYAFVQTQVDLGNFIDYNLLQMAVANTDWPNNNQTRFRDHGPDGRWRWLFWDTDFAFGLAPNSRVEVNMAERVLVQPHDRLAEEARLLRNLMQNRDFQTRFRIRAEELLATVLRPENMTAQLNQLVAELAPNIQHEVERWPGSSSWEASVAEMRGFVQERPFIFQQNLEAVLAEHYGR